MTDIYTKTKRSQIIFHPMTTEFDLIHQLTNHFPKYHPLHTGIGDDAAVIGLPHGDYQIITTDTLVEGDHFRMDWSTPEQIGRKSMEVNVSDIAAMGGEPTYGFISLVLTKETKDNWIRNVYAGIKSVCEKYHITLAGGDTTHGQTAMISITLLGSAKKHELSLRSGAKPGDLIAVTGQVGGSAAGYFLYKNIAQKGANLESYFQKYPYLKKRHLEPAARLEASREIRKWAHSMIDISDGVGSETRHIAEKSKVGVKIYAQKLPIHSEVSTIEKELGLTPYQCALSGGEDFELLFTIEPDKEKKLRHIFTDYTIIGEVTNHPKDRILVHKNGTETQIPGGWDQITALNEATS